MKKKFGVLLSGCGFRDGAEINEAVLTLLALDLRGIEAICMAPDVDQARVINYISGKNENEKRNVLKESARIARGRIKDVKDVSPNEIDALILPGGSGATLNFTDRSIQNPRQLELLPEIKGLIRNIHDQGKPIGSICIAPKTVVMALSDISPEVTIGDCKKTSAEIEAMGGKHIKCAVDGIHVDHKNKIVSTPAYMLGPGIKDVYKGIDKLVEAVLWLCS
ncbi:isoprenoid biosynthesis glyoxalase ElbB [Desulforegula conservatrix]|uniref:isoprenoid biosynthesis glyoxalase ElbB n=1 Tax=Desulforegula conservatrix TaxID=153026 RepID=UPI000425DCCD|nr:isoprenoid biosynthesis glyoxalase ElbB [Desulforegula conservatrix]